MAASGAFAFGAASHHAAILSRMTPAAQREEIATSLCRLRELTRGPTDLFAYPGGEAGDWDENTKELLRELGVELAVTAVPGQCRRRTPRLELPRFVLQGDSELRTLW
jgi:peptidoglycan/xylan/chitin deacetylase (PgdA/CDA1 family)